MRYDSLIVRRDLIKKIFPKFILKLIHSSTGAIIMKNQEASWLPCIDYASGRGIDVYATVDGNNLAKPTPRQFIKNQIQERDILHELEVVLE